MKFVRGDTNLIKFKIEDKSGQTIKKEDIDTLILTCKRNTADLMPILFQKRIDDFELRDDEYYHCTFKPEDTQKLDYGIYFFDIEVTLKNGYRKTQFSKFELTEECTTHKEE